MIYAIAGLIDACADYALHTARVWIRKVTKRFHMRSMQRAVAEGKGWATNL